MPPPPPDRFRASLTIASILFILNCPLGVIAFDNSAEAQTYQFHHEGILGTSFDLVVRSSDPATARLAEVAALAEIDRLRKILSTYDPGSEISQLNASRHPAICSPELLHVLKEYEGWKIRSHGAFNGQIGELIRAWRAAERLGSPPDKAALANFLPSCVGSGWSFDACERKITRLSKQPLNVDSLGKGYIIGKAAAAARAAVPSVAGLLINIGGDILASGQAAPSRPWRIGIANSNDSADNAAPLTQVLLSDRAISTSGAYERGYTIQGRRYSHILDPRTGVPAEGVASATVIARDSATANALATTLCVLRPEEGLDLVRGTPGGECLIVAANGEQFRSAQFAALEIPASGDARKANEAKPSLWPEDFRTTLMLTLKAAGAGGRGYRRPYVAVWAENEKGARVRTIVLWGNQERYFPDLYDWSYGEKDRLDWAATIARATRPAGRHRIVWDGRDDSGNPVPRGVYTLFVEANREHGTYAKQSAKVLCGDEPAHGVIKASTEFEEGLIAYGPPPAE